MKTGFSHESPCYLGYENIPTEDFVLTYYVGAQGLQLFLSLKFLHLVGGLWCYRDLEFGFLTGYFFLHLSPMEMVCRVFLILSLWFNGISFINGLSPNFLSQSWKAPSHIFY